MKHERVLNLSRMFREGIYDPVEDFAVGGIDPTGAGGDCDRRWNTGGPVHPKCLPHGLRLCDMQKVGGAVHNVAANTDFELPIEPNRNQWFIPIAVQMFVHQSGAPSVNKRVRVTGVTIADSPQEPINTAGPTAATTAYFLSDTWNDPDYPTYVQWGAFSVASLTKQLKILGFNPNGCAVDIVMTVWGNAMDQLPNGYEECTPKNKCPLPREALPRAPEYRMGALGSSGFRPGGPAIP